MLPWIFIQKYTYRKQLTMFYCVISIYYYVELSLPTCVWQWESVGEINSLKVKNGQPSQCRNGKLQLTLSIEKKLVMLIMFSEKLRHCQLATRIDVADAFCLSSILLPSLGGIFLKVSKLSRGKCPLSFQNFQIECTV